MSFTDEELAAEEWREVPSVPGYACSNLGRVKNVRMGRVLARNPNHNGYPRVSVWTGKPSNRLVHVMVAETFIGPRPEGLVVRHFPDRDPANCRVSNLSYSTQLVNLGDRVTHGTLQQGERHCRARLCRAAVQLMRWLNQEHGASHCSLAEWFGVDTNTARPACLGLTWRSVPYGLCPK